jgi:hypothetical protein
MLTSMKLVSAALFAVLLPTIAAAQNSGVYIQAGPLADILFTGSADGFPVMPASTSSSPTFVWDDSVSSSLSIGLPSVNRRAQSRVAPGASAAVGVFITPSASLRLEGSFQGERVTTTDTGTPVLSIANRQATAVSDILIAAGWHQGGARRTTITYLAGMVFRRQHEEASFTYTYLPRILPLPIGQPVFPPAVGPTSFSDEFGATTYSAGIMAGVDVTFTFSTHLAVVPQLRMVAANHELSVRPGISLQWRP